MVPSLGHCPKSRSGWRCSPSLIPGTRTSREAMAHKWRRPPGSGVRDGRGASRKRSENARNLVPKGAVRNGAVDFEAINAAAMAHLPALCTRWLPDGRREGREWSARNPRRVDRRPGSFKVNLVRQAGGRTSPSLTLAVAIRCPWRPTCLAGPSQKRRAPWLTCSGCLRERIRQRHVRSPE